MNCIHKGKTYVDSGDRHRKPICKKLKIKCVGEEKCEDYIKQKDIIKRQLR